MKKRAISLFAAVLLIQMSITGLTANASGRYHSSYTPVRYTLHATATTAGEPVGVRAISGSATLTATIDLVAQAFCYQVTATGLPNSVRGIIANAPIGKTGKSLIPVASVEFGSKHMSCVASHASILQKIVNSPSEFYFEVQFRHIPNSGIRGQLHF